MSNRICLSLYLYLCVCVSRHSYVAYICIRHVTQANVPFGDCEWESHRGVNALFCWGIVRVNTSWIKIPVCVWIKNLQVNASFSSVIHANISLMHVCMKFPLKRCRCECCRTQPIAAQAFTINMYIHPHIHTYIRTYTHTYIHTYTYIRTHTDNLTISTLFYNRTYTHTRTHEYTHIPWCIHAFPHTYTHTYIHTYTDNLTISRLFFSLFRFWLGCRPYRG